MLPCANEAKRAQSAIGISNKFRLSPVKGFDELHHPLALSQNEIPHLLPLLTPVGMTPFCAAWASHYWMVGGSYENVIDL